jgi:GAF domain
VTASNAPPKLKSMEARILDLLPESSQAELFLCVSEKAPLKLIWASHGREAHEANDQVRLRNTCRKRQRTVLVHDAEKDSLLRNIEKRTLRSALCVPVLDESKQLIGLLCLFSDKVEAFTNQDKFAWKREARNCAPLLQSKFRLEEKVRTEKKSPYAYLYSPLTLITAAILGLGLFFWTLAPADKAPQPDPTAIPNSTYGPRSVGQTFMDHLQKEELTQAWQLLDPTLQNRWSEVDFVSQFESWSKADNHKAILEQRSISQLQRSDDRAKAIFYATEVEGDDGRWNWEFRESNGSWKLVWMEGGPVESPGDKI